MVLQPTRTKARAEIRGILMETRTEDEQREKDY